MTEITSTNNETVKETAKLLQRKYRDKSGKFLLEGYKSVYEAVKSGIKLDKVFVLKEKSSKYGFINSELILTNSVVLKKISSTDTPPEVVAVGYQFKTDLDDIKNSKRVILLENISDAGNLGTIVRTAAAFGVDAVILYGNAVDVYNPKCVRSAAGNLWKTKIVKACSITELKKYFTGYERVAALPRDNNCISLKDWIPADKVLIMFGSEADGLTDELKHFATKNVMIEMRVGVESLNLSIAAGVMMYKLT